MVDAAKRDAFAEKLFSQNVAALELQCQFIGSRLGLYKVLAKQTCTFPSLAREAGIARRYAQEWLEQQAVCGNIECDNVDAEPDQRVYRLDPAHAEVLLDNNSEMYVGPFARLTMSGGFALPKLLDAFRTGAGVDYAEYGADCRESISDMNGALYRSLLGTKWFPAMPEVHARLADSTSPAAVADVACGSGQSTLALAKAYPAITAVGIDLDAASIDLANQALASAPADVASRVSFHVDNASAMKAVGNGRFDLVTIFEALHDMGRPVECLAVCRSILKPGGSVIVCDEKVADRFTAPCEQDRLYYAWSVTLCLPNGLADAPDSLATGTVFRESTMRRYAEQAGFTRVSVEPVDNDMWRFYRLMV